MRALEFITGHVIYYPAYTYKFQLKTSLICIKMTSNKTYFFMFLTDVITVQIVQTVRTNQNVLKKSVLPIITCVKMTIAFLMSGTYCPHNHYPHHKPRHQECNCHFCTCNDWQDILFEDIPIRPHRLDNPDCNYICNKDEKICHF